MGTECSSRQGWGSSKGSFKLSPLQMKIDLAQPLSFISVIYLSLPSRLQFKTVIVEFFFFSTIVVFVYLM